MHTRELKILELPNLPPKGDVSDWLDSGGTRAELGALVLKAPAFGRWAGNFAVLPPPTATASDTTAVAFSDRDADQLTWLWEGRIARGKLSILDGDPGLGKTYVTLDIAARLSRGEALPFSPLHAAQS